MGPSLRSGPDPFKHPGTVNMNFSDEEVAFFNPAQFGVNFVANSVITSKTMLEKHPETVKKFLTALLQGWQAAMNPENALKVLAAVKKLDKGKDDALRKKQLIATRELIQPTSSVQIGTLDLAAWQQTETIMLKAQQIKKPVHIEQYLHINK